MVNVIIIVGNVTVKEKTINIFFLFYSCSTILFFSSFRFPEPDYHNADVYLAVTFVSLANTMQVVSLKRIIIKAGP